MFYKFIGGDEATLLDVFTSAVVGGSIKLASVLRFNDPFEFKFAPVAPTRAEFDEWHRNYGAHRTHSEIENAWSSFSGPSKDFNTAFWPRAQLMGNLYVLCLTRRWNSHLMWAHYATAQTGFVICYRPDLSDALRALPVSIGQGNVTYSDQVPALRWFSDPPRAMAPILATKSSEWSYEQEYRVTLRGPPLKHAIFETVDPNLVSGVIIGSRAPLALIDKALALQERRKEFSVEQISSVLDSFEMTLSSLEANRSVVSDYL